MRAVENTAVYNKRTKGSDKSFKPREFLQFNVGRNFVIGFTTDGMGNSMD